MKTISIVVAIILTLFNYGNQKQNVPQNLSAQSGYVSNINDECESDSGGSEEYTIVDVNEFGDICIDINGVPTWVTPLPEEDIYEIDWNEFDVIVEELDGEFIQNENDNSELT